MWRTHLYLAEVMLEHLEAQLDKSSRAYGNRERRKVSSPESLPLNCCQHSGRPTTDLMLGPRLIYFTIVNSSVFSLIFNLSTLIFISEIHLRHCHNKHLIDYVYARITNYKWLDAVFEERGLTDSCLS
ncbi:hypothetical protein NA56DRAFT_641958, partial [Hyaloscypha hepaticicola]